MKVCIYILLLLINEARISNSWTSRTSRVLQRRRASTFIIPTARAPSLKVDGGIGRRWSLENLIRFKNYALHASPGDEDTAMSAYDQAMRQMASSSVKPDPPADANVMPSIEPDTPGETSSSPNAVQTFTNDVSGFSYFPSEQESSSQQPDASQGTTKSEPPSPTQNDFLESAFNNPAYASQEKRTLEATSSWSSSSSSPSSSNDSDSTMDSYNRAMAMSSGPAPGSTLPPETPNYSLEVTSPPGETQAEEVASNQSKPRIIESPPKEETIRYSSFLEALAPNSEKKVDTPKTTTQTTAPIMQQSSLDQSGTTPVDDVVLSEQEGSIERQQQQGPAPIFASEAPNQQPVSTTTSDSTSPDEDVPFLISEEDSRQTMEVSPIARDDIPFSVPRESLQRIKEVGPMAGTSAGVSTKSQSKIESFLNTGWEEAIKKPNFLSTQAKAAVDATKKALGVSTPSKQKEAKSSKAASQVKSGVTKRIFESLSKNARGQWTPWDAFLNAEERWSDLKKSRKFRYDFKLFKPIQNEAGPPLQFVSDDCAMGNARACAKLRDVCEKSAGGEECMNLDFEAASLDENGLPMMDFDIIVLGGTMGIFYAVALQLKGMSVCVVAPRELRGQDQEWNVGLEDLLELQRLGIVSAADIDAAVTTMYAGTRAGFKSREVSPLKGGLSENRVGFECYVNGVLNLGVSPVILIERVAKRFKSLGGTVREMCPLRGVAVSAQIGCAVDLGSYDPAVTVEPITSKMVLDCMGYGSPVARQQRYGVKPDGICMVFGSMAGGYNPERNRFADTMYTFTPLQDFGDNGQHQYFWESFPVKTNLTALPTIDKGLLDSVAAGNTKSTKVGGPQVTSDLKTTYMFTYIDADRNRPSLEQLMDDYWSLLPSYQSSISNPENDLNIKRVMYDYFPAYRDSPLKPMYSRVLSIGEAAGTQSPISFGGFRSLSRHIGRVSSAVSEAVETGCLHRDDLGEINAYLPNLSAAWLFRDIMSVPIGQDVKPDFTNRVLAIYLKAMYDMGPATLSPFLQDILRFDALTSTLLTGISRDPFLMGELISTVGMAKLLDFVGHVGNMALYGFLDASVSPLVAGALNKVRDPRSKFQWRRRMEAWKYGSGNDFLERKRLLQRDSDTTSSS